MTPLTIEDIREPRFKSGFRHVGAWSNGTFHAQVYGGKNNTAGHAWQGPHRTTAEEAAQDAVDYKNGVAVTPATRGLKTANHPRAQKKPLTEAQKVALDILRDERAKSDDPGTVYLVIEGDDWTRAKIGWTGKVPAESRMGDYQAGNPRKLVMIGKIEGTKDDEKSLHRQFIDLNILGEWFRLTDAVLSKFNIKKGVVSP